MSANNDMMYLINQARIDARSDKMKRFCEKHKKHLSGLIIVILVSVIGFFIYRAYQKSQEEKYSEILHQSLLYQQVGEIEKARQDLNKIHDSGAPANIKAFASLRLAGFFLEENNQVEAIKLYSEINACGSCDDYIHDLAGLLMVKLWVSDEVESKKEDLLTRIEKIESDADPLKLYIVEQRALLEMRRHELEKSYQAFDMIVKEKEVSPVLKARAQDGMKMVIGMGYNPVKSESVN